MRARASALDLLIVLLITVLGGIAYFAAGVRFDASPFPIYLQFIDDELLRDRMLESVWYSHAHPPGLNILVGSVYGAFGEAAPFVVSALFHVLGALLALAVFSLTLRLTSTRVAAYVCVALLVLSPGFVLYQNWLMYTFLEVVILTASAVALYQTLDKGSVGWAVTFFSALAVLVLTRGLFHLGWFFVVVWYAVWAAPKRARALGAAVLPLLAATLWYAKNYYYYGTFAASTMFGLGLSNIGTLTVPRADLEPLVEQGVVSPLALVSRYEDRAVLFSVSNDPPSGIPVLDRPRKANGEFNYNYRPLIAINEQYARDSFAVIKRYPASYLLGVLIANRLFFSPSSMNEYFSPPNRSAVRPFERLFNPVLYAVGAEPSYIAQPHFGFARPPSLEVNTSWWLIALCVAVVVFAYLRVRPLFVDRTVEDRVASVTIGYMLFTMVYVYGLGTLVELGENYRYRFVIEPFIVVVAALAVTDTVRRFKAKRR